MPTASEPLNILVVEHSEVLSEFLCRYLRSQQHSVHLTPDLSSARAALASANYDVLITDIGLPDGDGRSLINQPGVNQPPFTITMSGFDPDEFQVAASSLGERRHLRKPFAAEELVEALKAVVLQRSAESAC